MKRLITFAVTIITAVCLAACSAGGKGDSTKPNNLNSSFQAVASIILDELNAESTVKRFGSGSWEVEFSAPNTLSGVKLSFSEGNVTASYKGLNFSVPQSALPVKAMMLNLISAVDDLAKNEELSGTEEDGMLKITGSLDGGEYTLCVTKDGSLASFEMPNNKLKITFTNVTPISGDSSESSTKSTQPDTEASEPDAQTTSSEEESAKASE